MSTVWTGEWVVKVLSNKPNIEAMSKGLVKVRALEQKSVIIFLEIEIEIENEIEIEI